MATIWSIRIPGIISSIVRTGTGGINDEAAVKSIVLVNTLSVSLGSLILVIGALFWFLTQNLLILLPATAECLIAFSALLLNHYRRFTAAALLIFCLQCAAVLYFGIVLGEILMLQLMVVFLIAATYLIFNSTVIRRCCLAMAIATLATLEICYFNGVTGIIPLSHTTGFIFKWCSMGGVLLLIIVTGRQYVRSSDFRRVFFYQITHELRTPLNAVMLAAQLIKRELRYKPDARNIEALTDHMLAAGSTAGNILANVLDMARHESGKSDSNEETVIRLLPFFENILQSHRVIALYRNIQLRFEMEHMPALIKGDPHTLHVIMANLLSNAIQYGNKHSEVTVRIEGAQNTWQIRVTNTGAGIPKDKLDHIFEPFVTHRNVQVEGTGLGLFITRIKTMALGGNIAVKSTPGEYTTFTVTLPLREGDASMLPEETQEELEHAFNMHVLIADDNDMNNILLAKYLRQLGCRVTMTINGLEALQQAEIETPDLMILDYHMPVMDGKEALLQMKQTAGLKHIPVIMATGDAYQDTRQILMDAGAEAFLQKPINFHQLHHTLQTCLKR
ncbi:hybrid sensor histidine kinase/response regulator [Chitinophaga barathri]|uniref:histidine kinase n=1 Tax=Chitinophaga barathri TaxID=1647451 RepID=A0A3N4MEW8_9BACT|nr:hybrid sensor histidine kinase/response regulator [Chitinophaga barathri]RPD42542.1 response regulator [Chitinophaga barathri]